MSKKDYEKKVLSMVYDLSEYFYDSCESPDFIMRGKNHNHKWGVEITSTFFHESSARLKKIKNYKLDLLDGKDYKHKNDKEHYKVEDATLTSDRNVESTFKAIFSKSPRLDEYLENIKNTIKRKNKSYRKYKNNLSHINLIIYDEEDYFHSVDSQIFQKIFFRNGIDEHIIKSKFREIFLITTIKGSMRVIFPLKLMWFVSKSYKFNYMYNRFYEKSKKRSASVYLNSFMKYLYNFKVHDAYFQLIKKHPVFYYARSRITFDNSRVNVFEEPELLIPSDAKLFEYIISDYVINDSFESYLNNEENNFDYTVDLYLESKLIQNGI